MMGLIQALTTAWTVWKVASKRVGPVAGILVTVVVMAGLVYLRPWISEKFPAAGRVLGVGREASGSVARDP